MLFNFQSQDLVDLACKVKMTLHIDPIKMWNFIFFFFVFYILTTLSTLIGKDDAFVNHVQKRIPDVVFRICQDVFVKL